MISKTRFLLLVFYLAFSITDALCQDRKEFIVTTSNDTIYGILKYDKSNPELVNFKKEGDESFRDYSPEDLRFFYLKTFESFEAMAIPQADKKIFILRLESGRISLYKLRKGYLLVKDSRVYKLDKRDTVINNNVREDKKYTGLLKVLTEDCEKTKNKGAVVHFSDEELTKFIRRYNNCGNVSRSTLAERHSRREASMIGIKVGMNNSKLNFHYEEFVYSKFNFDESNSFNFGIFGSMALSRKIAAVLEYNAARKSGDAYGYDGKYGNLDSKEDAHFDLKYNRAMVSLRYFPLEGRVKPFVTAGVLFGYSGNVAGYRIIYVPQVNQTVKDEFEFHSRTELGTTVGVGLNTAIKEMVIVGVNYNFERSTGNLYSGNEQFKMTSHFVTFSVAVNLSAL